MMAKTTTTPCMCSRMVRVFRNGLTPSPPHDSPEILHTRMYNAGIGRSHSELKGDFDVSFRRAASWQLFFFEFGLFAFSV
jgi:hypothetical protein